MAVTWKLTEYPSFAGTAGAHFWKPVVQSSGGSAPNFLISGAVTPSGYTSGGPDAVTAFGLVYDTFGNLQQSFNIDTFTVTETSGEHHYIIPSANGGVGFYTKQDGSGHWLLERDVITGGESITQSITQIDSFGANQKIETLYVNSRPNDATPTYNVSYDVYDSVAQTDTIYEQTFQTSDNSLIGSRTALTVFSGITSEANIPDWQYRNGGGGYALATESTNSNNSRDVHFQTFTVAGVPTGTPFDLGSTSTNVTDIHQIRYLQDSATNHYFDINDEVTSGSAGERVALRISGISQTASVPIVTNITTPLTNITITQQTINNDIVIGYGDANGGTVKVYSSTDPNFVNGSATPIGTFSETDGLFVNARAMGDGRVLITSQHFETDGVTSEYVFRIVDFRTPGQTIDNSLVTGTTDRDYAGTLGSDSFIGIGADSNNDRYMGAAGSDTFKFDASAVAGNKPYAEIMDYDHSGPLYTFSEADHLDVSAIVGTAFGGGQLADALVRVVASASGAGSYLQVDSDGTANGAGWATVAKLDGIHDNHFVSAVLSGSQPAGSTFSVQSDGGFLGDFDNDHKADVLWQNDNGSLATWQMDGGTIANSHFFDGVDSSWHVVGIGDFNGDHKDDILWLNDNGSVLEYQMNGFDSIGATPLVNLTAPNGGLAHGEVVAGVGDFSGDHVADILWRDQASGDFTLWNMNGATVTSTQTLSLDTSWAVVGTGDYNGDGIADVMFRNAALGVNAAWLMNGTTTPTTVFYAGVPNDWHVEATGDFNGDGIADLFWHNDNGSNAVWLLNNTGAVQSTGFFDGVSPDWHVIGAGDFNNDGKTDLLWRQDTGATAVWQMDGTNTPTVTFPSGVPSDWDPQTHKYDFV